MPAPKEIGSRKSILQKIYYKKYIRNTLQTYITNILQKDITENATTYSHQRNTNLTVENTVLFAVKLGKLT